MPSRDADARVLEQFLRTMAPPAALTATYRQRVVRASLEARTQVVSFRRIQRCVAAGVILCCALLAPAYVLTQTAQSWMLPAFRLDAAHAAEAVAPVRTTMHAAVDGFELSIIQFQLQSRAESWAAAQRSASH
jgi:hypothetical protein